MPGLRPNRRGQGATNLSIQGDTSTEYSCCLALQTHTIRGLEHGVAANLFSAAATFARSHFSFASCLPEDVFKVELEAIEILGKESWDLLECEEGKEKGRKVDIAENRVRSVSTKGSPSLVH